MNEHQLQVSIMAEVALRANQDPRWGLLFAIPNGGKRSKATAGRLKAEGVKAGVPDLFLPVARGGCNGIFIELKVGNNLPSPAQRDWIERLDAQGYLCYVVWDSPEKVIRIIENYLGAI